MKGLDKTKDLEIKSMEDLERIIEEADKFGMKLAVIGGYAVRAYTRGYRYTKDIDAVIQNEDRGGLVALLKSLGYDIRKTEFGIASSKKLDEGFIDLHISFGRVWDMSANTVYPANEILKDSKIRKVSGYFDEGRTKEVLTPVASLEDILILKMMPIGRDKDRVDIVSMLIDNGDVVDVEKIALKCSGAGLNRHIREQIRRLIGFMRKGETRKEWLNLTGQRFATLTETNIIKQLRWIEKSL
ncbi:MAG: nucleotidyl transferase AbiEii/AbiGii toxin family protein [Thermoplasmata archaeon]